MNFSEEKNSDFPKKVQTSLFQVDMKNGESVVDSLLSCETFKQDSDFDVDNEKRLRIKSLIAEKSQVFAALTFYEPKASVPITPNHSIEKDLQDIDNLDMCHIFFLAIGDKILTIFQIKGGHQINRINQIFKILGLEARFSEILNKNMIEKIRKEGVRSVSLGIKTNKEELERAKDCSGGILHRAMKTINNIFQSEEDDSYYGVLTLDRTHNPALIKKYLKTLIH